MPDPLVSLPDRRSILNHWLARSVRPPDEWNHSAKLAVAAQRATRMGNPINFPVSDGIKIEAVNGTVWQMARRFGKMMEP